MLEELCGIESDYVSMYTCELANRNSNLAVVRWDHNSRSNRCFNRDRRPKCKFRFVPPNNLQILRIHEAPTLQEHLVLLEGEPSATNQ